MHHNLTDFLSLPEHIRELIEETEDRIQGFEKDLAFSRQERLKVGWALARTESLVEELKEQVRILEDRIEEEEGLKSSLAQAEELVR